MRSRNRQLPAWTLEKRIAATLMIYSVHTDPIQSVRIRTLDSVSVGHPVRESSEGCQGGDRSLGGGTFLPEAPASCRRES